MTSPPTQRIQEAKRALQRLTTAIRTVFVGQEKLIRGVVVGLLSRGNLLLEGPPGLGKTLLVKVLSETLDLSFSRLQFTPDLMPADITGTQVLVDRGNGTKIAFQRGPIFANLVLADEINRATPKTQSALLEAMQEHAVTVGGLRRQLDDPFLVIATQNPIEMEGTYSLPEAQLDRFMLKLVVTYPNLKELTDIGLTTTGATRAPLRPVLRRDELVSMQALVREVVVASHVVDTAARWVMATHPDHPEAPESVRQYVRYGASPRALQALLIAGRATALLAGRSWVTIGDLLKVAIPIFRHRIIVGLDAELEGVSTDALVGDVLVTVPASKV